MKTKTEKQPLFVLCYRQGTPLRYRWKQTLITGTSRAELANDAKEIERMGYKAHIMPATRLPSGYVIPKHGLPESYGPEYQASNVMDLVWPGGWLADADAYFEWARGKGGA